MVGGGKTNIYNGSGFCDTRWSSGTGRTHTQYSEDRDQVKYTAQQTDMTGFLTFSAAPFYSFIVDQPPTSIDTLMFQNLCNVLFGTL